MKLRTKILIGIGFVLAIAILAKAVLATYYWYQARQWFNKTDAFTAALQKPFAEDTYGGKTPEETWAMYVAAIKKRDIDLASKYYDVNHQDEEKKFFEREKQIDNLNLYIYQISNPLKKNADVPSFLANNQERAYYFYQFVSKETGKKEIFDVNFYFNDLTKVWKILY